MTDPEIDKKAVADAVRHDAKVERDEDVTDELNKIDRLADALADDETSG